MESERVKNVYINVGFAVISNILIGVLNFIVRKIFIDRLGVEYLGYNSVFTNLLQFLNMSDLGVCSAITSYLYKPIAKGNQIEISSLMYLYKKIYRVIGFVVMAVGSLLTILMPYIITDATCSNDYLRIIFVLNLAGTLCTYFLAYKTTLLIADQKNYLLVVINFIFNMITIVIRIVVLLLYPNYILFLLIGIISTVVNNIYISIYVDKKYKYLDHIDNTIVKRYMKKVKEYVKDIIISKFGAYVYSGTDNVIISFFRGSLLTGYLANYIIFTDTLLLVVKNAFSSIQATYGNYINSVEDKALQRKMTDNYLCINYCIGNFCMICFFFLVQQTISLIFGDKYLLPASTPFWLGLNMMLTLMLTIPTQVFTVYRLYRFDRWVVLCSALGNIVISVVLVQMIGIDGVLIGTFVTSLFYIFTRFYIISHKVFEVQYSYYLKKFFRFGVITAVTFLSELAFTHFITGTNIISFIFRIIGVVLIALIVMWLFMKNTEEYSFLLQKLVPSKIRKRFHI